MTKVTVKCALCGKAFQRSESQIRENNFCCREHFYKWNSQRMTEYNRTDNPMNKPGGVMGVLSGVASSVAPAKERRIPSCSANTRTVECRSILGRPLKKGEVVHHIDGNKLNNDPANLEVLPSQSEHCKVHGFGKKKGR